MRSMLLFLVLVSNISYASPITNKPWTVLIYIAAANDLNPYALYDLQEMLEVGSTPFVNVIVYLTIQQPGQKKQTKKLYIEKDKITQIGPVLQRDSGDVATFSEALQWACLDYPSEKFAVIMWDHGSGALNRHKVMERGVCYDYDTGHYLTDQDCLTAFSWVCNTLRGGKKIDIIACDACLLASLELAYTFASCADYYVASEETIPGAGFQYAYLLSQVSKENMDPLSFARWMIDAYNREYAGTLNYTLSITDLTKVQALVDNVNAVGQILASQLKTKNFSSVKAIIKKSIREEACISFDQGNYIDLLQFYKNILKNAASLKLQKVYENQFKQLLLAGINLFPIVVPMQVMSKNYRGVGGLSLYFSRHAIDPSYYGLYWTKKNPMWLTFLEAYAG